jgi:hypothetical protein
MKVTEIKKHILESEPDAHILTLFPSGFTSQIQGGCNELVFVA